MKNYTKSNLNSLNQQLITLCTSLNLKEPGVSKNLLQFTQSFCACMAFEREKKIVFRLLYRNDTSVFGSITRELYQIFTPKIQASFIV